MRRYGCADLRIRTTVSVCPHWLLIGIISVAVVLRMVAVLVLGDGVAELPGISDQRSYHALALRLMEGHGFSFASDWWPATRAGEPTAHWSYLYTGYLAALYLAFGPHPLVPRLVQAVLAGILQPTLAWRLGQRAFGPTAGLAAAALTAVYAYFIYYGGALMTETFYILAILWTLDLATQMAEAEEGWRPWLLLGMAWGITTLLRQVILLFVPFLLAWLWWRRSGACSLRSTIKRMLATGGIIALLIAPWTVRNYLAFGRFVLLNTNAGFAFFWANHPVHGTSFMAILPPGGPSYQDLIPLELRHLDEAALDQALLRRGLGFVLEDPRRYVLLSLSRFKDYFKFWPSPHSNLISNIARVGSFGLCLPLMAYGLWSSATQSRGSTSPSSQPVVILLWLFIAVYTAIHLLSWALIRYRLPVDAALLLFAGLAVSRLWQRLAQRSRGEINKISLSSSVTTSETHPLRSSTKERIVRTEIWN